MTMKEIFLGVNPEKFMILNIYKEILPGGDDEENKFSNIYYFRN